MFMVNNVSFVFCTGILSLVASGVMATEHNDMHDYLSDISEGTVLDDILEDTFEFPYSLFLFGLGGVLLCIVSLILLIDILISQRSSNKAGHVLGDGRQMPRTYYYNTSQQQVATVPAVNYGYNTRAMISTREPQTSQYVMPAHVNVPQAQPLRKQETLVMPTVNTKPHSTRFMPAL